MVVGAWIGLSDAQWCHAAFIGCIWHGFVGGNACFLIGFGAELAGLVRRDAFRKTCISCRRIEWREFTFPGVMPARAG
jgi:hypothetical protein